VEAQEQYETALKYDADNPDLYYNVCNSTYFSVCIKLKMVPSWTMSAVVFSLGIKLAIDRLRVQIPVTSLSCNNSGQVVCTRVPLSSSSTIWYECKVEIGKVTADYGRDMVYCA